VSGQVDPPTNFQESGFRSLELVLKRQEPRQLAALEQRADGATKAAGRMVAAPRERSWEGDDVLPDQLEAWLGSGVVRDLRPLLVDLDQLAGILDFAG